MVYFFIIIKSALMGIASAYFANRLKKDPYIWFLLGFLFGLISLVILLILDIIKKKKSPSPQKKRVDDIIDSRFWYYLSNDKTTLGPLSLCRLKDLFSENKISPNTYVWAEDFKDWTLLKNICEYKKFFKKDLPAGLGNSGDKPLRGSLSKT